MTDTIDMKQLSATYTKAIEAMKKPYSKVIAPEQVKREPKFIEPPIIMRNYFGENFNNGKS